MNSLAGKQSTFAEVQPLQGSGGATFVQPANVKTPRIRAPYFSDPLLVPRVEKYLAENHDMAYVNIDHMVSELQRLYRDYSRKKRIAFQALVQKAFEYIVQKNGVTDPDASSDGSVELNTENNDETKTGTGNRANDQLVNLYTGSHARKAMEVDKELINISSDEENDRTNEDGPSPKSDMIKNRMPNISIVPIAPAVSKRVEPTTRVDVARVEGNRVDTPRRMIANKRFDENISIVPLRTAGQPHRGMTRGSPIQAQRGIARGAYAQPIPRGGRRQPISPAVGRGVKLPSSCFVKFESKNAAFPPVPPLVQNSLPEATQFPLLANRKRKASDLLSNVAPIEKAAPPEKKRREVAVHESTLTLKDFGGYNKVLEDVCKLLMHIRHPEVYHQIGVSVPRGFLLHGPPGCGKTLLAEAIAGELQVPLLRVAGPELIGGISGESEERIRDLFDQAISISPCILFIDEVDAITPNRQTAQREMERRIVAQLLTCMDELSSKENGDRVLVIGATNRPDSIDSALRRAGRFDREVSIGIPDIDGRIQILGVLCNGLKLSPVFDFEYIARNTPGYVGADLLALVREAAMAAVNRVFFSSRERNPGISDEDDECVVNGYNSRSGKNSPALSDLVSWLHDQPPLSNQELLDLHIEMVDFKNAMKCVQPSAKREGFATVPDVVWEDIGALEDIREELQMAIIAPVKYPQQCASLGLHTPTGVLLFGPPGCGKTLLAKAVANEAGINFISVKGPELLNMYVGESERAVRQCFQRARNSAPCVIFFDELDSLCPRRSDTGEGASMRVVNQMLTEMDGIDSRKGVYLMAASNRPDIIDPAVLRPGRLDKLLYVGLPTPEGRVDIMRAVTKDGCSPCIAEDVSFEDLVYRLCDGYTGADIAALVREASLEALREYMMNPIHDEELVVTSQHFDSAAIRIRPSVPKKDLAVYEKLRQTYSVKLKSRAKPEASYNTYTTTPQEETNEEVEDTTNERYSEEISEEQMNEINIKMDIDIEEEEEEENINEEDDDDDVPDLDSRTSEQNAEISVTVDKVPTSDSRMVKDSDVDIDCNEDEEDSLHEGTAHDTNVENVHSPEETDEPQVKTVPISNEELADEVDEESEGELDNKDSRQNEIAEEISSVSNTVSVKTVESDNIEELDDCEKEDGLVECEENTSSNESQKES